MKLSYTLSKDADGYVIAECVESDVAGEGRTEDDAVASLKKAIRDRLFRPDAVAPPSRPVPEPDIELVRVDA